MYLVALLSSKVTRDPHMVKILGERELNWTTWDYRLTFPNHVTDQDLHVYTDSNFAPSAFSWLCCSVPEPRPHQLEIGPPTVGDFVNSGV